MQSRFYIHLRFFVPLPKFDAFDENCLWPFVFFNYLTYFFRHSVACFLTRGDLWVSWEEGQAVFEELLLDADWSLNAGNWMWLSASAFFHQYYRVYSPVAFGKKTDPLGKWHTYF